MISKLKITLAVAAVVLATTGCNSLTDLNNSLASVNDSLAQVNDKLSSPSTTTTSSNNMLCYEEISGYYYDQSSYNIVLGRNEQCRAGDKMIPEKDVPKTLDTIILGEWNRSEERRVGKECRSRW